MASGASEQGESPSMARASIRRLRRATSALPSLPSRAAAVAQRWLARFQLRRLVATALAAFVLSTTPFTPPPAAHAAAGSDYAPAAIVREARREEATSDARDTSDAEAASAYAAVSAVEAPAAPKMSIQEKIMNEHTRYLVRHSMGLP